MKALHDPSSRSEMTENASARFRTVVAPRRMMAAETVVIGSWPALSAELASSRIRPVREESDMIAWPMSSALNSSVRVISRILIPTPAGDGSVPELFSSSNSTGIARFCMGIES